MPEDEYNWLPREDVLHFEEISALVDVFLAEGVDRLRLTGGEPLLRRDLPELVKMLSGKPGLNDLALTTNGVLLAEHADALAAAGLRRITVSLDTLRPDRFKTLTRFDELPRVHEGMAAAKRVFGRAFKIDTVVIRGVNDDELVDLIEYGKAMGAEVRFIEYMDVGGATKWSPDSVVSRQDILSRLAAHYGPITPIVENSSAPADRFALPDGTTAGIISSTTAPFCSSCDRSRLTADGMWVPLPTPPAVIRAVPLRRGASADIAAIIRMGWHQRRSRRRRTASRSATAARSCRSRRSGRTRTSRCTLAGGGRVGGGARVGDGRDVGAPPASSALATPIASGRDEQRQGRAGPDVTVFPETLVGPQAGFP
jgi:cyclic pyranopterin phosphate synthase